ncbi:MAG TPA: nucleoside hydrolase [Chthonomonadaceae bacterium]|nr:nucleoside hydrolase [Chthonomonadaceae bacterium]
MPASARQPLLLDTDIGTDIDDVYALILGAVSPEFDLRAVTVVNNDVTLRARLARRVLDLLGRPEVPVSLGSALSLTPGERRGWMGHEGLGIALPDETSAAAVSSPESEPMDAARRIAVCAEEAYAAGTPLLVCTIGAMTNLALALRCYPESARHIGQVVSMAANFEGFGPEKAHIEHNIACDPVAVDIVFRSGLPVTLVGLNVTMQTAMTREDVDALEAIGGPLAEALVGMHRVWFAAIGGDRSPMHDGLALAQRIDPTLLTLIDVVPQVLTHGPQAGVMTYTPPDGATPPFCRIATAVDAARFHELLQSRVRQAVQQAKERAY